MIAIGQIAKSNGVRGAVNIRSLTDDVQRFLKLKAVWIGKEESETQRYEVESVRVQKTQAVMKLRSIDDREAADGLREQIVFVQESEAVQPSKGSYFFHDIIGMQVVTEEGEALGEVKDVWQMPANDIWVVSSNGKEILIPAIKVFIKSVDMERRTVVVHAIEGLLE
ncbi:MAG: ribosome maturation factor RimM [Ignavibacteriae bacterium]|nr:ribosome maturation factor RimM [Ignavibacteriota bacterium]